ncbi:MAG: hypothetical protein ACREM3_03760 [Candidatus Rokuibacteriota bacterium]
MSGQPRRLLTFLFGRRQHQEMPLDDRQRALITNKFEMLRQASFGFTEDRLLHLQEDDSRIWSEACTGELRRKITSAAPPRVEIILLEFRALRCISLQCRPVGTYTPQVLAGNATTMRDGHHRPYGRSTAA